MVLWKVKFSKIMKNAICTWNLHRKSIKGSGLDHSLHMLRKKQKQKAMFNSSRATASLWNVTSGGVEQPNCKNLWLQQTNDHPTPSLCSPDWPDLRLSQKRKTESGNPCRRPVPAHTTPAQQIPHRDVNDVDGVRSPCQQEDCYETTSGCRYLGITTVLWDALEPWTLQ